MKEPSVTIIGGGLAGSEAAWQLARRGHQVRLVEMKPAKRTPAQTSDWLAELVCSNSFRSDNPANAIGLLHEELRRAGSLILAAADRSRVPAGDALAVDRERFAAWITAQIEGTERIERIHREADRLPEGPAPAIVATGPLTSDALAKEIAAATRSDGGLYFYDAIAPIVDAESVDHEIAFAQSRNDKGGADYLNLPLNEAEYHAFVDALLAAEKVQPHAFEEPKYFDGCLPIEVIAERGRESLAFGPMKARGLRDPRTGERPFAVVQLRREDVAGTSYNLVGFQTRLTWPEQRRILRTLPGLANAEFLRMGQIHRNTFLDGPSLLGADLSLRAQPHLFFAGQITGVEGYVESTALGLLAALAVDARLRGGGHVPPPPETALGALIGHVTGSAHPPGYHYQPTNVTWALFPPLGDEVHKTERRPRMVERARAAMTAWGEASGLELEPAPLREVPALPKRKSRRTKVRERAAALAAAAGDGADGGVVQEVAEAPEAAAPAVQGDEPRADRSQRPS